MDNRIHAAICNKIYGPSSRLILKQIDGHEIVAAALQSSFVKREELFSKGRARGLVLTRQVIVLLLSQHTHMSFQCMANFMRYKDHTMIIYCIKTAKERIEANDVYFMDILTKTKDKLKAL